MRVGMYEVREQLVHLVEGHFSLTGRGRYVSTTLHQLLTPLRTTTCQAHLRPDRIKVLTISIQSAQKRLLLQLAEAYSCSRQRSSLIEMELN